VSLPKSLGGRIAVAMLAFVVVVVFEILAVEWIAIIAFGARTDRSRPPPVQPPWTLRPQGNPREQEAIDAIVALGGTVSFDPDDAENLVCEVHLTDTRKPLSDALVILRRFGKLKTLTLGGAWVTDAVLNDVKELTQLTTLNLVCAVTNNYLEWNKVTDAGLKEVKELTQLVSLTLICPNVSDAGLEDVKELQQLTTLNLTDSKVTDKGLKELTELKQLTSLNLSFTGVTDAGLKDVKELQQLTTLNLGATKVTDKGLKELTELKQLTSLDLSATELTDKGLKELTELKLLTSLDLEFNKFNGVTDAGLRELQQALPKCNVAR
jgi:Leucine-rich repeat (LRR) protein